MAATTSFLQQPSCSATVAFSSSKAEPRIISQLKHDPSFVPKHKPLRLGDFIAGSEIRRNTNNVVVHAGVPPEAPLPDDAHDPCTKVGLLGATAAVLVSLFQGKWWVSLLKLIGNVDTRVEQLEEISDVVEGVAEKVDKAAEAAAKHLPDGKLQDAAEFIEKWAERVDECAELTGDVLEKVDSFLDSATHQEKTVANEEAKDQNFQEIRVHPIFGFCINSWTTYFRRPRMCM